MTVSIGDIQDYLDWRQEVNAAGIRDSVEDFAEYRERLDSDQRVENTINKLKDLIKENSDDMVMQIDLQDTYELLTGVEYEPDDM